MNQKKIKYWVSLLGAERPNLDAYHAKMVMDARYLHNMTPEEKVDLQMLLAKISVTIDFLYDEAFTEPKKKSRFLRK
jgi:hypothetical protein